MIFIKKLKYFYEYKNLENFNNQYYFLKEYFYNPQLDKEKLVKEIKDNFSLYINNTKINSIYAFNLFYNLLYNQYIFDNDFQKHIKDILNCEYIDADSLYLLLNLSNKKNILKDKYIQLKLIEIVNKEYQVKNYNIIEHYILPKYHYFLFLRQIELRIEKEVEPHLQKILYDFIYSIINDPTYGKNKKLHYINSGGYKNCLKMGDYVLQIGEGPHITKFPQCSQISAPILFKIFNDFQISLSYFLETPIIEREKKKCYFKARDEGVILLDSKKLINFGKYRKPYIHPYKNISNKGKEFLGINHFDLNDVKKETVKYLDVDFYIKEDDTSKLANKLKKVFYSQYKDLEYEYTLRKEKRLQK